MSKTMSYFNQKNTRSSDERVHCLFERKSGKNNRGGKSRGSVVSVTLSRKTGRIEQMEYRTSTLSLLQGNGRERSRE